MEKDEFHQLLRTASPSSPGRAARLQEPLAEHGLDSETFYSQVEMSSRFVDAHQDVSYAGETVIPHAHNFYEMVYCISGNGEYLTGAERIHISHGDVLSIPAGLSHSLVIPDNSPEPYRRYVLWLSQEYIQLLQSMFLTDGVPDENETYLYHTSGTPWEHIGEYFRRCVQECEQKHFRWDTTVFGIATELSVQLARYWQGEQGRENEKPELLDQIMHYVESHLSERITVADIAARFWVSQSTVSQIFRKKLSVSFYRYVTLRRLSEAKVLIKSGIPMEQVSISVGFQDYSSFYRAFKAEYGMSPAQYRKSN